MDQYARLSNIHKNTHSEARLTFFDDVNEVKPSKREEIKEPKLRYVAPKSTTTAATTTTTAANVAATTPTTTTPAATTVVSTTEAPTTVTATTTATTTSASTAAPATPTISADFPTPSAMTTEIPIPEVEKKVDKLAEIVTQTPIVVSDSCQRKRKWNNSDPDPSSQSRDSSSDCRDLRTHSYSGKLLRIHSLKINLKRFQLPYLSKVSGVLTAGQSIQSTPWGTETNNDEVSLGNLYDLISCKFL